MMKTGSSLIGATAAILLVLAGCQTAKPVTPQESMIQTESAGFSPKADKGYNTIELSVAIGNRDIVSSWKVEIAAANGAVKTFSGDSSNLPSASLTWDGTDDYNNPAAEGTYTAKLSVDYAGKIPAASVSSRSTRPTSSFMVRTPREAMILRASSAMKWKYLSTDSGLPL